MVKTLNIYILALTLVSALNCNGAAVLTTAPRKGPEGNRFLFVVDTSSSMKPLEQAGRQVAFDLVYSELGGRMQAGDTFGIWTFGNEVKGGVFPIQVWSPEKNADLAGQVMTFLKEQSSGRYSRLDMAVTNAERLVKSVKDVDIVFITSAATRFKPDESWALLEQNWKGRVEEARKNKKAMVLTLAARGGQIMQAMVTLEGEPLKLMAPPPRRTAPLARTPSLDPPAKPTREPIILRGSNKERPLEDIPTKFAPPAPRPVADPLVEPAPEPSPVPVRTTENPFVSAPSDPRKVAAREPGKAPHSASASGQTPSSAISARMLIIAGGSLMLIAGVVGMWILIHVRSRNRVSYISRSLATGSSQNTEDNSGQKAA
jgi:hypothetical protein